MTLVLRWTDAEAARNAARDLPLDDAVVLVDPGDEDTGELLDGALEVLAAEIAAGADVVYGDELVTGPVLDSLPRPAPAAERLRCHYYWGRVVAYRARVLVELAEFPAAIGDSALHGLALRATARDLDIRHVGRPLLTSDGRANPLVPEEEHDALRDELQQFLDRTGGGEVRAVEESGLHDTRRAIVGEPLVSVVIPTRGLRAGRDLSYVERAIDTLVDLTTWQNYEIVLVYDDVAEPEVLAHVTETAGDRLTLVPWSRPFNFSGKINLGAVHARGEYLLILNDDVEILTPEWMQALLPLAQLPGSAMSGCMLLYDDGTVQHAGHHYWRNDAKHIGMFAESSAAGELNGFLVEREVVGNTAACLLMRRDLYLEVGGMTELLPGAFNDVDLCLKLLTAGHTAYWTPHAQLLHFESKTRDATVAKWEVDTCWGRWGSYMHQPGFWPYPD